MPISLGPTAQPSWPVVLIELNTTRDPNDPAGTDTWVDITQYAVGWRLTRGRIDELSDVQTATLDLKLRNDGRFDPKNAAGPYYPNLRAGRQLRIKATWQGVTYPLFQGYENSFWPQTYDHEGTYAYCEPTFVDAFAWLAQIDLLDCVLNELLLDAPLALYPLSDSGSPPQAGNISGTKLPNAPVTTATGSGTYAFGANGAVPTAPGLSGLQFVGPPTADSIGPNLTLPTPAMPAFAAGLSLEFSVLVTAKNGSGSGASQVLRWTGPNGGEIGIYLTTAGYFTATYQPPGGGGTGIGSGIVPLPPVGTFMHVVLTMPSTRDSCDVWLNGVNVGTCSGATWNASDLTTINLGGVDIQNGWALTLGPVATYAKVLSGSRIAAHYRAGHDAFAGEVPSARNAHLLSYAAWLPALENLDTTTVGDSDTPLQGMLDLAGKNVLQALKDTNNGVLADTDVDTQGRVRYRSRDYRLLQVTPSVTFGEGPPAGSAGELPYTTAPQLGAQIEKVFPQVEVDQVGGIGILRGDATSMLRYGPKKYTISTYLQDPEMVIDLADHLLREYKAEADRASAFDVDPSANPSVWPQMLALDIGQRARVMRRPATAPIKQVECFVEGFTHDVTPARWKVTGINTSAAPPFFPWILGDATYGVLGTTTVPCM